MRRPAARICLLLFAVLVSMPACRGTPRETSASIEPSRLPEGRLPEGVRPTSYRLSLEIIPERDTFSGSAMITFELDEPARTIWMHGNRLEVSSVHATHATTRVGGRWEQKTPDGVARVDFDEALPAGRSTLHFEYTAPFDTPLRGLYRVEAGGDSYAFTQFESISARLAFPGFDEPRFKTPFELTLTVPAEQFAAANTPVDRAIPLPNGLQRVSFVPTPPIPTYLLAFAVGPFDVVAGATIPPNEGRPFPIPLRGIAVKGKGPSLQFALEQTAQYVEELEAYFGIPYPYRKLDLVAVPDFAAGAMENVGLITFREWLLLLDAERATEGQRRAFAYVMAHELAHQWFGNLVTMPWWDDIWLNEAFATWMGNKVVHTLHPEFRADLASLASTHRAMAQDSLTSARSIRQPILSNHDIKNAFDMITYVKGGAVLSMFEHWMGPDVFREGIRRYLRRHRGGTATSSDLLAALDEASDEEVTAPFSSFLTQPGVPLLSSTDEQGCVDGARRLTLRQERYFPLGSDGERERAWQVPLCVRHERGSTCGVLDSPEGHIELPGCPAWWMPNENGAGYFRFSMSETDWNALRKRGLRELSDGGTIAVADSLYAEYGAGRLGTRALLRWFPSFVRSDLRQVATGPMPSLRFMMADGGSPGTLGRIAKYGGRLYRKLYQRLGWSSKPGDSSDRKLLREAVIRFMVMDVRDRHARSRAVRLGRKYVGAAAGADQSAVEPQLAALSIAAAVQEGDEAFFDHLVELLHASSDATTRSRILAALGHAESDELSERALQLAFDPKLRRNEIASTLAVQLRSPRTRERAWRWLTEHVDALVVRMGSAQAGKLPWYTAGLCSHAAAEEVRELFEPRVSTLAGGPRNLAGAIESISLCAARVDAQRADIDRAFAATRP